MEAECYQMVVVWECKRRWPLYGTQIKIFKPKALMIAIFFFNINSLYQICQKKNFLISLLFCFVLFCSLFKSHSREVGETENSTTSHSVWKKEVERVRGRKGNSFDDPFYYIQQFLLFFVCFGFSITIVFAKALTIYIHQH